MPRRNAKEKIKNDVVNCRRTERAAIRRINDDDSFDQSGHSSRQEVALRVRERSDRAAELFSAKQYFDLVYAHELAPTDDSEVDSSTYTSMANTAHVDPKYAWLSKYSQENSDGDLSVSYEGDDLTFVI